MGERRVIMSALLPAKRWTENTFETLRNEMESMFERFFGEPVKGNGHAVWAPRVDIEETDKALLVRVDLPGVDPKEIEISVNEGMLVLKGERKEEREKKEKNFHRVERFLGRFYRELPLPVGADAEKIVAQASKGVVTVTIPKKPEAQAKKIAVQAMD